MRKILITGASGDLVQEMVPLLKDDFLILLGRDKKKIEDLYASHPHKVVYDVDIRDEAALISFFDHLDKENLELDILVNNAGYGEFAAFDSFSHEQVQRMFEVNTFALMTLCRLAGTRMKKRQAGHIINIVSMAGFIGTEKSSVYSATKFAAIGFSDALRLELSRHKVGVTTINPGPIATKFFEQADPDGSYQKRVKAFLLPADYVAKKIVTVMGSRKRSVNLPWTLSVAHKFYTLFPRFSDYVALTFFRLK